MINIGNTECWGGCSCYGVGSSYRSCRSMVGMVSMEILCFRVSGFVIGVLSIGKSFPIQICVAYQHSHILITNYEIIFLENS